MNDRRLRILVLDDSVPYLDFMRLLLTMDGFEPTTTTTVEEAVRCLAATPYVVTTGAGIALRNGDAGEIVTQP